MSVYNAEDTVLAAVQSILDQTFQAWELVIVDDGSQDNSAKILEERFKDHPDIKFIKNSTNIGLSRSLNIAFEHCAAKYIARMDADDISYKDRLQLQADFLDTNTNIDVLGGNADVIDDRGEVISATDMPQNQAEILSSITRLNPLIHPTVMMRRDFLEKLSGYDPKFRKKQDYDLWLRGVGCYQYANLKSSLIRYRVKQADTFISDLYGFKVRVINSFRRKTYFSGLFWAFGVLIINVLRKLGYRQKAFRR
jgi:glycosyltransferase involved in cell wall biosynthesis